MIASHWHWWWMSLWSTCHSILCNINGPLSSMDKKKHFWYSFLFIYFFGGCDHYLMSTPNTMPYRPILPFCIFSKFGFDLAYFLQFKKFYKFPCGIGLFSLLVILIAGFDKWRNIVWLSSHQYLGIYRYLLNLVRVMLLWSIEYGKNVVGPVLMFGHRRPCYFCLAHGSTWS